jgi:hypothetical protein
MVKIDEDKAASEILSAMEFAYSCEVLPRQDGEFSIDEYHKFLLSQGENVTRWHARGRVERMVRAGILKVREGNSNITGKKINYYRKA